ncbi:MAG: cyclic nucleotide-binding domain-containing protein, partial [Alphaproteobacteria bacterium]|nr:cyclic nucleotide-binding domain-containing protein [Alphaproteobacteria bacterium]
MAIEDEIEMMSRLPVLGQLEPEVLRILAFALDSVSYNTGDYLYRKGDLSTGGYFLTAGTVGIFKDQHELKIVEPATMIGEMALIAQSRHQYSARAREPVTALRITRSLFTRILREYPGSAVRVRAAIAENLNRFVKDLRALEA